MSIPYKHSASFGKRIEYWIIGLMLKKGIDVYMPLVDDNGIDAIIRQPNGTFVEIQMKARSNDVKMGCTGQFTVTSHDDRSSNYYFIFYSERMNMFWIMSFQEFINEANKSKHVGKYSIWLNGKRKNKETGKYEEYCKPQFEKYIANDFPDFFLKRSFR